MNAWYCVTGGRTGSNIHHIARKEALPSYTCAISPSSRNACYHGLGGIPRHREQQPETGKLSLSLSISVLGIVAQQAREADRCLLRDYGGSSSVWAMESPRNIAVSLFYRGCYSVRGRARRSYVGRRNRACSTRERTVLLSCRGGGIVTFETVPVHLRCTTCPTQPVALMPKTPSLRQPRPPRAGRDASYTSTCMGTAAYIQKCSNVL